MKIKYISLSVEDLQLSRPYTIAFKTISSVENGILRIHSEDGRTGHGAFNPIFEVVGETLTQAVALFRTDEAEFLAGRDIRELNQLCDEVQQKYRQSPALRTAFEIALYDLFCQNLQVPLVRFLGRKIQSMPTSVTIGILGVEQTLEEAREYIARKFRILKVKLGKSIDEDIERMLRLHELCKDDVALIVDANQGYDRAELLRFKNLTAKCNIRLIEQPVKAGNEHLLAGLPDDLREKLVADESLLSVKDASALSATPLLFGYFNIKLMKCGGITEALKIASVAESSGIRLMWGCNDESKISITAALHVAFACANTGYIDLDGSLDLKKDVVGGGFELKDGWMTISDKPGLGLETME
ncbi:mandelate racemase/muconate lactonizing enzyme family protein [Dyadobacter sp. CY323]|uniref:mandelate racemase/muconate lactonizing enzyme family protein n=1 Tax=Dyadobacter sp. CY323 TaxID=2907302 RepID=UPI001F2DEB85|nr:dipeptide epimerase [Dyadobacter sp. CY323]MCE6989780.1 dipeptide epimerase [Dyadobacter sp. CY323]